MPESMTSAPRWTARDGKRPTQRSGRPASSTDPSTWVEFSKVSDRAHGVMLGDGLACWDLDGVIDDEGQLHPDAVEVLRKVGTRALWVERSMSGHGLHVFVNGSEQAAQVGKRVSYYSRERFIAVSGERYSAPRS